MSKKSALLTRTYSDISTTMEWLGGDYIIVGSGSGKYAVKMVGSGVRTATEYMEAEAEILRNICEGMLC